MKVSFSNSLLGLGLGTILGLLFGGGVPTGTNNVVSRSTPRFPVNAVASLPTLGLGKALEAVPVSAVPSSSTKGSLSIPLGVADCDAVVPSSATNFRVLLASVANSVVSGPTSRSGFPTVNSVASSGTSAPTWLPTANDASSSLPRAGVLGAVALVASSSTNNTTSFVPSSALAVPTVSILASAPTGNLDPTNDVVAVASAARTLGLAVPAVSFLASGGVPTVASCSSAGVPTMASRSNKASRFNNAVPSSTAGSHYLPLGVSTVASSATSSSAPTVASRPSWFPTGNAVASLSSFASGSLSRIGVLGAVALVASSPTASVLGMGGLVLSSGSIQVVQAVTWIDDQENGIALQEFEQGIIRVLHQPNAATAIVGQELEIVAAIPGTNRRGKFTDAEHQDAIIVRQAIQDVSGSHQGNQYNSRPVSKAISRKKLVESYKAKDGRLVEKDTGLVVLFSHEYHELVAYALESHGGYTNNIGHIHDYITAQNFTHIQGFIPKIFFSLDNPKRENTTNTQRPETNKVTFITTHSSGLATPFARTPIELVSESANRVRDLRSEIHQAAHEFDKSLLKDILEFARKARKERRERDEARLKEAREYEAVLMIHQAAYEFYKCLMKDMLEFALKAQKERRERDDARLKEAREWEAEMLDKYLYSGSSLLHGPSTNPTVAAMPPPDDFDPVAKMLQEEEIKRVEQEQEAARSGAIEENDDDRKPAAKHPANEDDTKQPASKDEPH